MSEKEIEASLTANVCKVHHAVDLTQQKLSMNLLQM